MRNTSAKELFQLQTELIDMKVDMAVSKSIDRVIDQIGGLKNEVHGLRGEMNKRFSSVENRVIAVETKLGMVSDTQKEIRTKIISYGFKTAWLVLGAIAYYVLIQLQLLVK